MSRIIIIEEVKYSIFIRCPQFRNLEIDVVESTKIMGRHVQGVCSCIVCARAKPTKPGNLQGFHNVLLILPYPQIDSIVFYRNPMGRTGLAGRGLLGRWGPNHTVHFILTRSEQ